MARQRLSRDFNLMWLSSTVSGLGTRVSQLAFPTVAVLQLHALELDVDGHHAEPSGEGAADERTRGDERMASAGHRNRSARSCSSAVVGEA